MLLAAAILRFIFANAQPDSGRFWDERYGFLNVSAVLVDGELPPDHALYPSLSFLPHTALLALSQELHELSGISQLGVFQDRERRIFSATAYRLSRAVSILFGVWSLWLLYRLGSHVFDPSTALLATLLLATFWRHVWASGEFKPDILAVALTVLALDWSLEAVERESWQRFVLAGAGIGLATAAKYNAALVALPLVAAVALSGHRAVRLVPRLGAAGLSSLLVFVALNPWLHLVLRDVRWQIAYYERAAAREASDHWQVLLDEAEFFVLHHGPAVAACVAIGIAVLSWRAFRSPGRHLEVASLLSFAVGYPLLYAGITPYFLSQNMLPVAPLTCLFGAWTIVAAGRRLAVRWPRLGTRPAVHLGAVALFLLAFRFPVEATYLSVVPTSEEQAAALLRQHLTPLGLRTVFHERDAQPIHVYGERLHLPVVPVPDLTEVEPDLLDLADGEVFPGSRLVGEGAEFYLRRLTRPGVSLSRRIKPRLFVTHGQELVLVLHPWRELGEARQVPLWRTRPTRLRSDLAGLAAAGDVVSFSLYVPRFRDRKALSELRLNGDLVPFYDTGVTANNEMHLLSHRRTLGPGPHRITLVLKDPQEGFVAPRIELHSWEAVGSI